MGEQRNSKAGDAGLVLLVFEGPSTFVSLNDLGMNVVMAGRGMS